MGNMSKYEDKLNVLGETIKNYRLKKNLSYRELSQKLELFGIYVSAPSLYRIEINKRSIKDYELIGLSKVLGFSIDNEGIKFLNQIL